MDDVERDGSITINIGYGNITFGKDDGGPFATAVVDLVVASPSGQHDLVEVALRIPSAPEIDTILDLVERSRSHLAALLRAAADHVDAQTAIGLLHADATIASG